MQIVCVHERSAKATAPDFVYSSLRWDIIVSLADDGYHTRCSVDLYVRPSSALCEILAASGKVRVIMRLKDTSSSFHEEVCEWSFEKKSTGERVTSVKPASTSPRFKDPFEVIISHMQVPSFTVDAISDGEKK